ncbi:LTA synthase family protein [Streptococcus sp. DD12]|uniref:LTA synthase family protein n=1 Tax=Streptococcus sp. DD12 TaxID=1777880 RepID=UPI00079A692E|nr:LTA synthase family protein [Streptococcus sp. DD12]KXT76907.1 Lipoteichoic acid synthase LtaS Type IIc [Streptococcus sp. DD12]
MNRFTQFYEAVKGRSAKKMQRTRRSIQTFFPRIKRKIEHFSLKTWLKDQQQEILNSKENLLSFWRQLTPATVLQMVLVIIFVLFIVLYIFNQKMLVKSDYDLTVGFRQLKQFLLFPYLISLAGIGYFISRNIQKRFFIRLFSGYGIFLVASYFIYYSRNINNQDFKGWDLIGNHFFQWDYLLSLLLAIGLGIAYFALRKRYVHRLRPSYAMPLFQRYLLSILLGGAMAVDDRLVSLVKDSLVTGLSIEIDSYDFAAYFFESLGLLLLVLLIFSGLANLFLRGIHAFRRNQTSYASVVCTSLVLGTFFNYTIQMGVRKSGAIVNRYVFPAATLYQILALSLIALLCYMIFNRYLEVTLFLIVLGAAISTINAIKVSMRNEPLLLSDFSWVKEINQLLGYINISIVLYNVLGLIAVLAFYRFLKKHLFKDRVTNNMLTRVLTAVGVIAIFGTSLNTLAQRKGNIIPYGIPVLSQLNNWNNLDWMGQASTASYKSLLYVWSVELSSPTMQKPANYSKARMEALAKKYQKRAAEINASRTQNINDQTVIFVLSESLANPDRIAGVTLSSQPLPFINSVKETSTGGLMKSDGYGGGTANMEFQSLTGLPLYNLSSSISSAMTQVGLRMSYVPSISNLFENKNKIAIHLGDGSTYSRSEFYKKLGFDTFIARENGTKTYKDTDALPGGTFPRDAATYDAVLDNINTNQNQFFSVITYQNHTPWTYTGDSDISASDANLDPGLNKVLDTYTKLINQTDQETQTWLSQLSQIDKKITVVFYGDHLPGYYPTSVFSSNPGSQYQTDYFIWSNYETPKLDYPYVNSSDFPAELLAVTQSKVSPYYALLTDVLNNASVDKGELDASQKDISEDLKLVEYDLTTGDNYLTQDSNFFKVE